MAAAGFLKARETVVHRDHDDLLHFPGAAKRVHGSVQFPTAPTERAVRPGGTEDVLAVMQIQHRIMALRLRWVGRREINVDTPIPAKKMRWQVRVQQGTVLTKSPRQVHQQQKQ